jgi:uncharacterized protein YhhL (DUF1145 family)
MLKSIYRLIIIGVITIIIYGLVLPYLISSNDDIYVVAGFLLGIFVLPILVKSSIIQIKKLTTKENKQ